METSPRPDSIVKICLISALGGIKLKSFKGLARVADMCNIISSDNRAHSGIHQAQKVARNAACTNLALSGRSQSDTWRDLHPGKNIVIVM